jgi:hypothetical protein
MRQNCFNAIPAGNIIRIPSDGMINKDQHDNPFLYIAQAIKLESAVVDKQLFFKDFNQL